MQDLRWKDSGAAATGRAAAEFMIQSSLAACRVPKLAKVRALKHVPRSSNEYVRYFAQDVWRQQCERAVQRAAQMVAVSAGLDEPWNSAVLALQVTPLQRFVSTLGVWFTTPGQLVLTSEPLRR